MNENPSSDPRQFARRVFAAAGIYGLVVLVPMYFLEGRLSHDLPPPITHPEYYYGFVGVAVAWQLLFLLVSRDPVRYRLVMLPSFVEKLTYGGALLVLFGLGRTGGTMLVSGLVDLVWGALFLVVYARTPPGP
jgi:hypothetical protein